MTIGELREADAARILLELAPSAGDEDQARALARCLGRHPLSLRLAGSYLRSQAAHGATFAAYGQALGDEAEADPYARERCAAAPAEMPKARALKLSLDGPDPSSARIRNVAVEFLAASAAKLPVDQPGTWPQYLLLGSHLLSLLETAADRVDREHLSLLMETAARIASAFQHSGASQAGNVLCQRALTRGAALGTEHRAVLRVRHEMAWAVAGHGDLDEAEALYRDVFQIRLRVLGARDEDVLDSRHELAWIAARRGRIPEAEARYSSALNQRRRILGEDHPQTLATQKALKELRRGRIVDADHLA